MFGHSDLAFYFYDLAANGGSFRAEQRVRQFLLKDYGVQRDRSFDLEMLEQAVGRGDHQAKHFVKHSYPVLWNFTGRNRIQFE